MKKLMAIAALAASMLAGGTAIADGPGGSEEARDAQGRQTNNVECGDNSDVAGMDLYAGENGAEFCNDTDNGVLQGRVIVGMSDEQGSGPYAAADGDRDNTESRLRGYVRVDPNGVDCSNVPYRQEDGAINDADSTDPNHDTPCRFV